MYKTESSYSRNADDNIRKFGLSIPFILIAYGLLIQFNIVDSPVKSSLLVYLLIVFGWIALGLFQFLRPSKTAFTSVARLSLDHIMAALSCVYITMSVLYLWPILLLASYIYFDKTGVKLSLLVFAIIVISDTILHGSSISYIFINIMTFIIITITSLAVVVISSTREIKQAELYQSKIKESLQRDRVATIVNNLTDAIISTDINGIIRVYNAASLDLLDTNINLNGRNINKVLPLVDMNENKISVLDEFQKLKTAVKRDDLNYIFNSGEKIRLEVTYTPIRSGFIHASKSETHDGYIIILRDITKAKSLEEERDEYVSVVSHELRTPITIAEGTLSNVQIMMEHPDATFKMLKESINIAHDEVMYLANIVNDLSSLSHAESEAPDEPEEIDVRELAHELINRYSNEAKKKKLALNLDLSSKISKIFVSKIYLEELLQNFITNAIKYTNKGSVTFSIDQDTNKITFSVIDTGIGISKSDQPKIFDKFYRSEDFRTRETGGTGLGLYVASKLATQLGTKINLISRLNFGSTFSFELPLKNKDNK